MTGPQLLQDLKTSTNTESFDNITDAEYYEWLSKSHKKICEFIKAKVDSKYFMAIAQADLVLGQYIYDRLGFNSSNGRTVTIIDAIWIKYDSSSKPAKATPFDIAESVKSREELLESQSQLKPLYQVVGNKIMIFPNPNQDIAGGIELIGSRNVGNITSATIDSDIFNGVLSDYHSYIVDGAKSDVYERIGQKVEARNAKVEFEREGLETLRAEVSYTGSQPISYEEPSFIGLLK